MIVYAKAIQGLRGCGFGLLILAAMTVLAASCGREPLDPRAKGAGTAGAGDGPAGVSGAGGTADGEAAAGGACAEGATRCASPESSQKCKSGSWTSTVACSFVCVEGTCGQNPKTVFVTSSTFVGGSLGGLDGADAACQKLALGAMLSGTYRAWLSDPAGSPATRFPKDGGPYQLLDGTTVANNWIELTSRPLLHTIDVTDRLQGPTPNPDACMGAVWSNTYEDGSAFFIDSSCGDWSDPTSVQLMEGSTTSVDHWSYFCAGGGMDACGISLPVLCFEQ